MPTQPTRSGHKSSVRQHKLLHTSPHNLTQHGLPSLLSIPQESLTHVTSYLPPPSLLALACTCRPLCDHVDDDNTWFRALLTQLLNISPEHTLESEHIILLRRTEHTWRKEFIFRYAVRRRWERSRNPTVTHAPQDSSIDGVHLMPEHGLLTSSIQYGIVARSIPLTGKVLKGYIDAAGTGLGIGNPNVEFTPDVSACVMVSEGSTARVFWGKRNGQVALTIAHRAMQPLVASGFIRCRVDEQHEGAVQQLVPDPASITLLSAGADGRIKLWDAKTLRLLWSTDTQQVSLVTDPFVCIAGGLSKCFVAGALKSGDILLCDLHEHKTTADEQRVHSTHQLRISSLLYSDGLQSTIPGDDAMSQQQIGKIWLYQTGDSSVLLLVQYTHHPQLYRIDADVLSRDVTVATFGDSVFSDVSVAVPVVSTLPCGNNMVIVGDLLGYVGIYDLNVPSAHAVHRFEAHTDGSVTAIAWSPTFFATGSARGTTVIWDSLTLEPVRYFTTFAPRPPPGRDWDAVSEILLDEELVVIIVGNRVMTWKVGQVNSHTHGKRAKHANGNLCVTTKGRQQYEMSEDIAESYRELEYERAYSQRVYSRQREQRSTLDTLGLSELEAVEYILMLSRDEEEARQSTVADEGDIGDFSGRSTPLSSHPPSPTHRLNNRPHPRVAVPISNEKVQVSPPFVPEPMEAGTSISPLRSSAMGTSVQSGPMAIRSTSSSSSDHFPSLSSSLSSTSSSRQRMSTSPGRSRSAWNTPLNTIAPLPGPSSPRGRVVAPAMERTRSSNMSLLSVDIARHRGAASPPEASSTQEMDDDLRLAIELSLAEARSRGEAV